MSTKDAELGQPHTESIMNEKLDVPTATGRDLDEDGKEYPPWRKVIVIMGAVFLSLFITSLDRTIISTAIPQLTDEFHSFGDIGWYGSAYMITACSFQLLYGRIYTFYSPKWVFLSSIGLFELGSLICGVAPTSKAFIVGRAIAGLGSAGIMGGAIILTVYIIPLRKRPILQAFIGIVFMVAFIVGPLLGGVLTTNSTWRWCFYLNLPIGGLTIVIILLFLEITGDEKKKVLSFHEQVDQLDPIGTVCLLSGTVCLLLALQWGGSIYAWKSGRIIALLVIFGVLAVAFVGVQIWLQEKATVPPRIANNRSVSGSAFWSFCTTGSLTVIITYLPIWFQAIQGVSAVESGIRLLPLILALVIASLLAGGLVSRIGYYAPFLIAGTVILSVGTGLLTTWTVTTSEPKWLGFQIIVGFGIGLSQQQAGLAAQTVLSKKDVATGVSLKFFGQQLGGAIFLSVAQNVLETKLIADLSGLPDFDPYQIVNMGATEIRASVPSPLLPVVLHAYNSAITNLFIVAVALAAISIFGALLVEWKSVKGKKIKGGM
ncbi:hypothetical protein MMC26_003125 [Xylographa opegraphella]|nr:hypothetical protein [Xylographa opegraphella]